jgi:hypothetical protein
LKFTQGLIGFVNFAIDIVNKHLSMIARFVNILINRIDKVLSVILLTVREKFQRDQSSVKEEDCDHLLS